MARAFDLTTLPLHACFAALMTLLFLAAITDLRERRIPKWLNAGVAALYPVYLLLSPVSVAWPGALAVSLLVGLLGLVLFARELIGGGDVKLMLRSVSGPGSTISPCSRWSPR
jgi:Flp pilus assembly protein protease CpaA